MSKKNRRKIRKALATMLAALLLVVVSVGATVAYLTSRDEVTNTFTVGKVVITLDEAKVNLAGKPVDDNNKEVELANAPRVKANEYKLMPGHTYTKDPTVTVLEDSEPSWIYCGVKVSDVATLKEVFPGNEVNGIFMLQNFVDYDAKVWEFVEFDSNTSTYIFKYATTVDTVDDPATKLAPLFTKIEIPSEVKNDALLKLEGLKINVGAFAIQADGMTEDVAMSQAKPAFAEMFAA